MEQRPKVLQGQTVKVLTGCGSLFITVNNDEDGSHPIEVFAKLGKSGGCAGCMCEALGRVISLGLQSGVSYEKYVDTLSNIRCPSPCPYPTNEGSFSCPDGIARAIKEVAGNAPKGSEDSQGLRGEGAKQKV